MRQIMRGFLLIMMSLCLGSCLKNTDTVNHEGESGVEIIDENNSVSAIDTEGFHYEDVPAYDGKPYVIMNDNHPYSINDSVTEYIRLGEPDELGRCTDAEAIIGIHTLPKEQRGSIGGIRPTGWQTVRYDDLIEGNYLYNRCHLIAYEISGINDDEKNLVTGTRYMNVEGMLPWENQIVSYIETTNNHVYYHCTPVFIDDELVCRGVLMEASSIEKKDMEFCVFCYNVQPGININYLSGESEREEQVITRSMTSLSQEYVLNTNTKRFHYPDCDSVKAMKEKNKRVITSSREEIIDMGYQPCAVCNP